MPLQRARLRISDYSKDQKNRAAAKERRIRSVSLSLTSMVDMFAILVIFLLTNSGSVSQWLELENSVSLPKAKTSVEPTEAPTLQLTPKALVADKKTLLQMEELAQASAPIPQLQKWLAESGSHKEINLVGHEHVPYGVIRKIISTCQSAGVQNVALAVQPIP